MSERPMLAELSVAVRESTLKRLRKVPAGRENWRPDADAMSFADLARHLLVCDRLLERSLREGAQAPDHGEIGPDVDRDAFEGLIEKLARSGEQRRALIEEVEDLKREVFDERFGNTTVWWVIARGNLDHETHHRGQLATYLRLC